MYLVHPCQCLTLWFYVFQVYIIYCIYGNKEFMIRTRKFKTVIVAACASNQIPRT